MGFPVSPFPSTFLYPYLLLAIYPTMSTTSSNSSIMKKTQRPSYVCTNCRRRKVKCDKRLPCTRCIRSKLQDTCTYSISPEELKHLEMMELGLDGLDGVSSVENPNEEVHGDNDGDNELNPATLTEKPYTKEESEVFNYPTLLFKKPLFVRDGDSVRYLSPISLDAIFSNNKQYVKFKSMMPFLFSDDDGDTKETEEMRDKTNEEIKIFSNSYTKQEIDVLMVQMISVNFDAILERLICFDRDYKNVITSMFLSYTAMSSVLEKYFIKVGNGYEYHPPSTDEENYLTVYATFANVLGVVQVVAVLTEFDETVRFKNELNFQNNPHSFGFSSLKCLAFSDYKTRPTFEALLGFLLYRMNFFLLDSVSVKTSSNIVFNIALEIAVNLGIHIRCDHLENYPELMVRSAWNVVQFMDAVASLYIGQPLKIDYRYAVPRLYEYWEPIVLYLRNVVGSFNSTEPISLNQIIDLANSASKLLYVFQSFEELLNDSDYNPVQYSFSMIIKGDFLICYQILLFILRLSIDEIDELPVKPNEKDLKLIEELKDKTECHLFYSLVLSFGLMKNVASGKISYQKQSVRLTVSMRLLFSRFMIIGNKMIFCYFSVFNKNPKHKIISPCDDADDAQNVKFSDLSLFDAENYLCKGLDGISTSDKEYRRMMKLTNSLPALTDYLMEFYTVVSDKSVLILYGKFRIHFKFLLYICLLLRNVHHFEKFWSSRETNGTEAENDNKNEHWRYVIDKTTEYYKSIEQAGIDQFTFEDKWNVIDSAWSIFQDDDFTNLILPINDEPGEIGESELDQLYDMFF